MSDEPTFPYLKFKKMKKHSFRDKEGSESHADDPRNAKPEFWYLNVSGVHNQPDKILKYERQGSILVGYGNLRHKDPDKFTAIKALCDLRLGKKVDPRLAALDDGPVIVDALSEKVDNEQKRRTRA